MYLSKKSKIIIAIVLIVLISFFIYKYSQASEPPKIDMAIESSIGNTDIGIKLKGIELLPDEIIKEDKLLVDVKGAVYNPGVYQMEKEDRVIDVIIKAGGLLDTADVYQVNLAKSVYDEMEIIVPKQGEIILNSYKSEQNGKVNINRASVTELITLSGIGEEKAKAIIKYRDKNGDFRSIEEIINVSGIAEGTFEKIKDNITI